MTITALPATARIWVFGAADPLTAPQCDALNADLTGFVRTWAAHGAQLMATHEIVLNAFIVVAVDESLHGASGCSIDAMIRHLAEVEKALDISLLDGARIWYRTDAGDIVSCERSEFQNRSEQGEIDAGTTVFDPTIETLGELRDGRLSQTAGASWHARLLASTRTA